MNTNIVDEQKVENSDLNPSEQPVGADGSNNLIEENGDLEAKRGQVPLSKDCRIHVNARDIADRLTAQFKHWEEGVGEAHERLYRFLGQVYEWAPLVKSQRGTESEIIDLIKERHDHTVKI